MQKSWSKLWYQPDEQLPDSRGVPGVPKWAYILLCLPILSVTLHLFSRCPVICFACSGDFYHELNLGVPWQGKCGSTDIVLSVTSLSLGALGLAAAFATRIWCVLQTRPYFGLVWLGASSLVARRCVLASALAFGSPAFLFDGFTSSCVAASHPAHHQRFAVVSSFVGMELGPDMSQCLNLQQQEYTNRHGYDLIRPGDCRELFRANPEILP